MYRNKKTYQHVMMMLLSGALTQPVHAGTMGPSENPVNGWVATLSIGPVWGVTPTHQTLTLQPDIVKTYTNDSISNVIADGEIFLGLQRAFNPNLDWQLGLAVATTSNATLSGQIWDDGFPKFNNHAYSYQLNHTHLAVKGKLLGNHYLSWVTPYVSASLGVAWNDAQGYSSNPLIFEALPLPAFASHSETSFTYTLGIGVQRAINQNWQVGVGYEFADWGQSQLGIAPGQTMGHGLSMSHFYTNGLMFSLTFLA